MITFFKDRNHKSKRKDKNYKKLSTILEAFDTFVIIASTTVSNTFSLTGIALIVIPISTGVACGLTFSNKVAFEIVMRKYNRYENQFEKDHQTIKSFDKLYSRSLQDNLIGKSE